MIENVNVKAHFLRGICFWFDKMIGQQILAGFRKYFDFKILNGWSVIDALADTLVTVTNKMIDHRKLQPDGL